LVTGADGYIGSRLIGFLAGTPGPKVRAIVRRPAPYLPQPVDVVTADLLGGTGESVLTETCAGVDVVIHLAGANEIMAGRDPERSMSDTVRLTERVTRVASRAGVGRIIYLSTVHVYGALMIPGAVLKEDQPPQPRHPYAIARLASEHIVNAASDNAVILRLTNSVGAPAAVAVDRWSLVANDLCRQAVTGGELRLRTSGVQWRDFIALADVCDILATAAGLSAAAAYPPGTYNVGTGVPRTVRQLAVLIQDRTDAITGTRPALIAPDPEPDPPGPYVVSTERLTDAGRSSATPISAAVDETISFCLAHRDELGVT
jgi:UDP-glucose 4-epimerase